MSSVPIADHALLSDCHSAALVTRDGSVDWLCFPRFDGPSVFARILDDAAGYWRIAPTASYEVTRRYLEGSLVLETTFATAGGTLVLTDALALGPENTGHDLGRGAPHLLVRRLACTAGSVEVGLEFAPRPEYGLISPILSPIGGGITSRGGAEWLVLSTPVEHRIESSRASGLLTLSAGDRVHVGLHRTTLEQDPARIWAEPELHDVLDSTIAAWTSWAELHQGYDGMHRELVLHSGRVLQGLTFQPSGAMVAAATTSLPEQVGGERNWDYRYSWVRDASFTMEALWVAACPDEAHDFFTFMATAAATSLERAADLQIMFGVGGERDLTERTLAHLAGWRESRPVRVGNGAWNQRQLDVYGELLQTAYRLVDYLDGLDADTKHFLADCADAAAARWKDRDQGIWEIRGEPQHFLYSKVMCWVALDRAIALADTLSARDRVEHWTHTREEIFDFVVREGWSEEAGAFTQYVGSSELDAANLMLPIVGFLPGDDPRIVATVDAIADRLTDANGLVYRYRTETGVDGLAGGEGTFLLCTFWLAHALAVSGQLDRARAVFDRAASYVNDVGLLSEEVDGATGDLLGNFPQAFSHIGLINAAYAIDQAS